MKTTNKYNSSRQVKAQYSNNYFDAVISNYKAQCSIGLMPIQESLNTDMAFGDAIAELERNKLEISRDKAKAIFDGKSESLDLLMKNYPASIPQFNFDLPSALIEEVLVEDKNEEQEVNYQFTTFSEQGIYQSENLIGGLHEKH